MKYVIARAINGISINGNEYLLDKKGGDVLEFDTRKECVKYCESVGLDDSYAWEDNYNEWNIIWDTIYNRFNNNNYTKINGINSYSYLGSFQ